MFKKLIVISVGVLLALNFFVVYDSFAHHAGWSCCCMEGADCEGDNCFGNASQAECNWAIQCREGAGQSANCGEQRACGDNEYYCPEATFH